MVELAKEGSRPDRPEKVDRFLEKKRNLAKSDSIGPLTVRG